MAFGNCVACLVPFVLTKFILRRKDSANDLVVCRVPPFSTSKDRF